MSQTDFNCESPLVGFERTNTRLMVGAGLGLVILLGVIVCMGLYIAHLESVNTQLANNRIMYAFPNEDGVLVSARRRPPIMVKRYAREFLSNRFTYDADSVIPNFRRAANMVVPHQAVALAHKLKRLAKKVQSQELSQKLTILSESGLQEADGGYVYTLRGQIERYVATTFDTRYSVQLVVKMQKVTPTEARPSGLWISGIKETPL